MTAPFTRSPNPRIRAAVRGLVDASDAQILQVVAMVDAMPDRGDADQIIAPLRSRLARLRPPRPLRFARLLFLPLDPLIVPAASWRPERPSIPRTAIPVIADALESGLGAAAMPIRTLIEGRTTHDQSIVEAAGARLWAAAAAWLPEAPVPRAWRTTGLPDHLHQRLARRIGALLSQATRLQGLMADAAQGLVPPETATIRTIMADAAERDPDIQPMLTALLLARVPESRPVLGRIAASFGLPAEIAFRTSTDLAAEVLLDQLQAPGGTEGQLGGRDLHDTAESVRRISVLLTELDGDAISAARRERLAELRERLCAGCESIFTERLSADLLTPLRQGSAPVSAEAEWKLEEAVRGLRALETEARRACGGKTYDTSLGQAADMVHEATVRGDMDQAAGLRLTEILIGAEVAMALFGIEV